MRFPGQEDPEPAPGESLGDYLRVQREVREVTLEDVQRRTKIRMDHLRALESDRFETLPAPVFVRNYIRAYAEFAGLDENEALSRYEAANRRWLARSRRRARPPGALARSAAALGAATAGGVAFMVLLGWTGFFSTFSEPPAPEARREPTKRERVLALKRELGLLDAPAPQAAPPTPAAPPEAPASEPARAS